MTFDRATIAAFVDGELDLVTAKRIEKVMATDSSLAKMVNDEIALRSKLINHFAPVLDEAVPDNLTALLIQEKPNNVDASLEKRRADRAVIRFSPSAVQWGAMAASLIVGLMIGGTVINREAGYVADQDGHLVASGALVKALDTQLASAQKADAKIRIGTSFAAKGGGYCRTFESVSLDGIACKTSNDWQLRQTLSGEKVSQYRQASASAVAEAAAAMMANQPLDAAEERAAMTRGWKQ